MDPASSLSLRIGNMKYQSKDYYEAVNFYTKALETNPKHIGILENRAVAYLGLRCYNKALEDSSQLLKIDATNYKGILRQIHSLWGLNRYEEALNTMKSIPYVPELKQVLEKAEVLFKQSRTGQFNMVECIQLQNCCRINAAAFCGPVRIVSVRGMGRGLAATQNIQPGQLLISSKPFAYFNADASAPNLVNHNVLMDHRGLVALIAQKLAVEPELGEDFYTRFFAGPTLGNLLSQDFASKTVDVQRITQIINYNGISNGGFISKTSEITGLPQIKRLGIWNIPSFINHSCSECNVSCDNFGDMLFIRAVKPIKAGNEILMSYAGYGDLTFIERQKLFEAQNFACTCQLCKLEKAESKLNQKRRLELQNSISGYSEGPAADFDTDKLMKNIAELECLQKNPKLNLSLLYLIKPSVQLSMLQQGREKEYLQLMEKIHFLMTDTPKAKNAIFICFNILVIHMKNKNKEMVNQWVEKLKHDLLVAYGSVNVMPILASGSNLVADLNEFGWNSFLC